MGVFKPCPYYQRYSDIEGESEKDDNMPILINDDSTVEDKEGSILKEEDNNNNSKNSKLWRYWIG